MAPEQARGAAAEVDIRSDVHALGAILYRLLSGRPPRDTSGETLRALNRIATEPASRLRSVAPGVGDELDTIVHRAMAPERERRYQTAGDLAGDLERLLAGEPIDAKRDSRWYVVKKGLRRHRAPVAAAALVALLVVASATALGVLYSRQLELSREARGQRDLARQRFDEVRGLANALITELDPLLDQLPGSAPTRRAIIERCVDYLDALADAAGDDVGLLRELGQGYLRVGDILGSRSQASVGDWSGALGHYRRAGEVFERARALDPDGFEILVGLQQAAAKRGEILRHLERWDEAGEAFDLAMEHAARGEALRPDDPRVSRWMYSIVERQAAVARHRGDEARWRELSRRANELADAAAARFPDDPWIGRDAAVGHMRRAQEARAVGDLDAALAGYRRFLEASVALRATMPDTMLAAKDVASGHEWVGRTLEAMGEHEAAAGSFGDMVATIEGADPAAAEPELQLLRLAGLTKLFEMQMALGDRSAAGATAARLVEASDSAARLAPDHPKLVRAAAVGYYKRSELHAARAGDESRSDPERAASALAAARDLDVVLAMFLDLEARGLLAREDAAVPGVIEGERDGWRRAAATLGEGG
jgi:tetratricopeptide (TPR) repeat protein